MLFGALQIDWSNSWIVNIGTGIISGLVVAVVVGKLSRFFISRKDDRERSQRMATANQEVMYALRSSVAEATLPSREILEALIRSTARKHNLRPDELSTIEDCIDDLIKDVMDSSFISNQQKLAHCEEITKLKKPTLPLSLEFLRTKRQELNEVVHARERASTLTSGLLGLIAGLFAAVATAVVLADVSHSVIEGVLIPAAIVGGSFIAIAVSIKLMALLYPTKPTPTSSPSEPEDS